MFDCRHLSDPYNNEELRPLNGKDKKVAEWLDDQKDVQGMVENAFHMINGSLLLSGMEKVRTLRVCFGCASGRHRSVYCAEKIAGMLKNNKAAEVLIYHHEIR